MGTLASIGVQLIQLGPPYMDFRQLMRPVRQLKFGVIALALGLLPMSAFAQGGPKKVPATQAQMNVYTSMGAVNICALNAESIPFDKSMLASVEMILSTMNALHGDTMQGANDGKPLERQLLANGSIIEMTMRVDAMCGKNFKGEDKKRLSEIISQIKDAESKSNQTISK
jgi:hypothetical protein